MMDNMMMRLDAFHYALRDSMMQDLDCEQSVGQDTVAFESLSQFLCRYVFATAPLFFEFSVLLGELIRDTLDDSADHGVRQFDGVPRIVYKHGLHLVPAGRKVAYHCIIKEPCIFLGGSRWR
jgi:hypothetical protein